jgi:hypothetical protein
MNWLGLINGGHCGGSNYLYPSSVRTIEVAHMTAVSQGPIVPIFLAIICNGTPNATVDSIAEELVEAQNAQKKL